MNLVFASGFLVPQKVRPLGINYFRKLKIHIEADGKHIPVFPDVKPLGSVAERAEALATQIETLCPPGDIHIIAHSMGGLDSRALIAGNLRGLSPRIKSLTTVATPHSGSPVADLLLGERSDDHGFGNAIAGLLKFLNLDTGALRDLRTKPAPPIPDPQGSPFDIVYRSYAAVGRPAGSGLLSFLRKKTCAAFMPTHDYIQAVMDGEENDGLVPLSSTQYGDFQNDHRWECDHADAVGWNLDGIFSLFRFKHLDAYDAIISELEKRFPA